MKPAAPSWIRFSYWAFLCAWFIPPRFLAHLSLHTYDRDFGLYENLVSNIAAGSGFYSSVLGYSHLGEHFNPILTLFVPAAWFGVIPWALLLAQGLSAVITIALLTELAVWELRELEPRTRRAGMGFLVLMFLFYRPFIAAWDFQFQPILLGAPLVACALWSMHKNRWSWLWLLIPALLSTRESAGLSVIGLGLLAWLRYGRRRVALSMICLGVLVPVLLTLWFIPSHSQDAWLDHTRRVDPFGDLAGKGLYLLRLLGPIGFLPLFGWRAASAALPGLLLNVAVGFDKQYSADKHYDAQVAVFLMMAAITGVRPFLKFTTKWGEARHSLIPLVQGAVVCLALFCQVHWQSSHPLRRYVKYWPSPVHARIRAAVAPFARLPERFIVSADPYIGPHLCQRRNYVTLCDPGWYRKVQPGQLVVVRKEDSSAARLKADGTLTLLAATSDLLLLTERTLQETDQSFVQDYAGSNGWKNCETVRNVGF